MKKFFALISISSLAIATGILPAQAATELTITKLAVFDSGTGEGGAEIATYHKASKRVFITNGANNTIDVVSIENPEVPIQVLELDMSKYGDAITSVAAGKYVIAVATHRKPTFSSTGTPTLNSGRLVIMYPSGKIISSVDLKGSQPDSVTFTPDGLTALVAIEGEPICAMDNAATTVDESKDYAFAKDPKGAIAIVNLTKPTKPTVRLAGFSQFTADSLKKKGLVVSLTSKNPAVDLEPEYITAVSNTSAYVSLQEANAIAQIDLVKGKVTSIFSAGTTDLGQVALDISDRDNSGGPSNYANVFGLAMPDTIASFTSGGDNYLVTANEGDDRADWSCFTAVDDVRIKDLEADPAVFPDWTNLKGDAFIGRAKVNPNIGDSDGDGLYEKFFLLSNRSFSIFKNGARIYDSKDLLEQLQIDALGVANINGSWDTETGEYGPQSRSDDKGPEPEGVAVTMIGSTRVAVIGMERMSALLFMDITDPAKPTVIKWEQLLPIEGVTPGTPGLMWSPEGMLFIPAKDSPNGKTLLLTSFEVSGTLSIHQIEK